MRVKQGTILLVTLGNHWQPRVSQERAGLGNESENGSEQ